MESNKLIAKFMGAKKTGSATGLEGGGVATEYKVEITDKITAIFYDKDGAWTDTHEMKFHSSWDWLVPVVQKINVIANKNISKWPLHKHLDDATGWRAWSYRMVRLTTDIDTVYKNVINFIEFYNKSKKVNQ